MRKSLLLAILLFVFVHFSFSQTDLIKTENISSLPQIANSKEYITLNCRTVWTEPKFKNGIEDWEAYLRENLRNDLPKNNGCPPGRYTVRIDFIISNKGTPKSIKAMTNYGYGMEAEAIRVISLSSQWTPSSQNGRATASYRRELITFDLCESVSNVIKMSSYL